MITKRIFHLIEEEVAYFNGPENYFCKHLPNEFQRIINIKLRTGRMTDHMKNCFKSGNLPNPFFPKMIDPGSRIYFHYKGCLMAYGEVEETIINYPNGSRKNFRLTSKEEYSTYPFSFKIKKGTFSCWRHEELPWEDWIWVINESGRNPMKNSYTKLNDEEDSKLMKLVPKMKLCQW